MQAIRRKLYDSVRKMACVCITPLFETGVNMDQVRHFLTLKKKKDSQYSYTALSVSLNDILSFIMVWPL